MLLTPNLIREAVASAFARSVEVGYTLGSMTVSEWTEDMLTCDADFEGMTELDLQPYVLEYLTEKGVVI